MNRSRHNRFWSLWIYFQKGHTSYFSFLMSFANFIVLQWALLVQNVGAIEAIFGSMLNFTFTFIGVYVPLCAVMGYFDYKKWSVPVNYRLLSLSDPWRMDLTKAIKLIAEDNKKEAIKILDGWLNEK